MASARTSIMIVMTKAKSEFRIAVNRSLLAKFHRLYNADNRCHTLNTDWMNPKNPALR